MKTINLHEFFEVNVLSNIFQKSKGFMFTKPKNALIFNFKRPQRVSFHMWFVFGSIDLFELDEAKRIIFCKQDFRPFSFHKSAKKVSYVVEVPAGSSQLM